MKTTKIRITNACLLKGEHLETGSVVEISNEDAVQLVLSDKAVYVPATSKQDTQVEVAESPTVAVVETPEPKQVKKAKK